MFVFYLQLPHMAGCLAWRARIGKELFIPGELSLPTQIAPRSGQICHDGFT
jgi:hypothetical protein